MNKDGCITFKQYYFQSVLLSECITFKGYCFPGWGGMVVWSIHVTVWAFEPLKQSHSINVHLLNACFQNQKKALVLALGIKRLYFSGIDEKTQRFAFPVLWLYARCTLKKLTGSYEILYPKGGKVDNILVTSPKSGWRQRSDQIICNTFTQAQGRKLNKGSNYKSSEESWTLSGHFISKASKLAS